VQQTLKIQKRELGLVKGQLAKVQIENHNLSMKVIKKEQIQKRQKNCNKNRMTLTSSIGRFGMT
jgi:hypothetical protein